MNELPVQLQKLNNFIQDKPVVVLDILKKNGIKIPNKPTFNDISRLSFTAVYDDNEQFVKDVTQAIQNEGESNFDPVTLTVSALLTIGSSIFGSRQAKKQRQLMANLKLAELSNAEKLAMAEIDANLTKAEIEIYANTFLKFNQSMQSESTARQRDTALFVGIMGVGLAVMYATVQIFKK